MDNRRCGCFFEVHIRQGMHTRDSISYRRVFGKRGVLSYKFNTPEVLISDNGTQFTSELFKKFLVEHKVRHFLVPAYHPQSNPVEATNKSVKTLLRLELLERANHADWSSFLQKAVMRLNTAPRMPTGQSPHRIVFGREKNHAGNHRVIEDENEQIKSAEDEENARELIYDHAAEEQRAAFERNKRQYNLRANSRTFKAGDLVYLKNNQQSSAGDRIAKKLGAVKRVAYVKEKVVGSYVYHMVDGTGKSLGTFHANEMYTQ